MIVSSPLRLPQDPNSGLLLIIIHMTVVARVAWRQNAAVLPKEVTVDRGNIHSIQTFASPGDQGCFIDQVAVRTKTVQKKWIFISFGAVLFCEGDPQSLQKLYLLACSLYLLQPLWMRQISIAGVRALSSNVLQYQAKLEPPLPQVALTDDGLQLRNPGSTCA